jgi:hypothetical protein
MKHVQCEKHSHLISLQLSKPPFQYTLAFASEIDSLLIHFLRKIKKNTGLYDQEIHSECEDLSPTARWVLSLPPGHSQKAQIDD